MNFISYAQNYEDVMLWRALKHIERGFYVDVGANDPDIDSVTKAFYEQGWRGINIDPMSQWLHNINEKRTRDINLNIAAGAQEGDIVFYEIPGTGLSTSQKKIAERHRIDGGYEIFENHVAVMTLTQICQTYHTGPIHFINIDVEGAEKDVLQGLDLTNLRPWIIVIESTLPNTQVENHSNWEELLTISDYEFVYFDGLNRFYIAREQSYLKTAFNTPPNFFDNLITSKQLYLENKVQQTDIANKHLENELVVTQEKIELLSHHAGTLESELANERSAKEQFQTTLSETRKQLSKAESNIIKAKTRTAQVEANANRIESELASAREKIDLLNHHTGVLESELTYERRTQKELQSKLAEFQNQIVQLQESTNKWWSIAEQKSDTIKVIYASWSWRVTWPLRKLFDVLNWICKWLLLVIRLIVRLPVRFVSWFVLKAMVYAINRDSLRIKLLNQVNKYPRLKARLFMIGHQKGLFNQSVNVIEQELQQHVEINANIDHLSPQAKNIYHDLKNAIEKSNKERI